MSELSNLLNLLRPRDGAPQQQTPSSSKPQVVPNRQQATSLLHDLIYGRPQPSGIPVAGPGGGLGPPGLSATMSSVPGFLHLIQTLAGDAKVLGGAGGLIARLGNYEAQLLPDVAQNTVHIGSLENLVGAHGASTRGAATIGKVLRGADQEGVNLSALVAPFDSSINPAEAAFRQAQWSNTRLDKEFSRLYRMYGKLGLKPGPSRFIAGDFANVFRAPDAVAGMARNLETTPQNLQALVQHVGPDAVSNMMRATGYGADHIQLFLRQLLGH